MLRLVVHAGVLEGCAAGATALHAAVENGHLDTSVALLKLGAKQTASMQVALPPQWQLVVGCGRH